MYSMRRVWCLRHRAKCSCCLPSAAVFYYRATAPFPMSWHLPPGHWIHCQQVSIQRTEQWWLLLNWTFAMQVIQWIALWISFFALLLLLHLFLDILIRKCHCVHLYDAPSQPMWCLDSLSFCENDLLMTAKSVGMQPRCCLFCGEPVGCQPALANCAQGWSVQDALSLNNMMFCFHFHCHYHWLLL